MAAAMEGVAMVEAMEVVMVVAMAAVLVVAKEEAAMVVVAMAAEATVVVAMAVVAMGKGGSAPEDQVSEAGADSDLVEEASVAEGVRD